MDVRRFVAFVTRLGQATAFVLGLIVLLGLLLGPVSLGLAAVGDPLTLGQANSAGDALTRLVANLPGPVLRLTNTGAGPALDLRVEGGAPPLKVNTGVKVTGLNADKLDGREAADLAGVRAYAHVTPDGEFDPARSEGVNGVILDSYSSSESQYCFDLVEPAKVAVGSPFLTNAGFVSTATGNDIQVDSCPASHRDAVVRTYGSDANPALFSFKIIFE